MPSVSAQELLAAELLYLDLTRLLCQLVKWCGSSSMWKRRRPNYKLASTLCQKCSADPRPRTEGL